MILVFALSGLGGVPGSSKSEGLGSRRAQGPPLHFRHGANEGPGTPPEKLNSDFGAKMGREPRPKGSAQRNARVNWG